MQNVVQRQGQAQNQRLNLAPQQIESLNLLAKSLPELRAEIFQEMARNPAIESVENVLEAPLGNADDQEYSQNEPDYPEDDYTPGLSSDESAAEKRQAFFDKQVEEESLQTHLLKQLPYSSIPQSDYEAAEVLIGNLNDDGYYVGSLADVQMSFGKTKEEIEQILNEIMQFDPVGCGAQTLRECLLVQVDLIENLQYRKMVTQMIDKMLPLIAAGKDNEVSKTLGITQEQYKKALGYLRILNPRPGRLFPSEKDKVEYLNPEVRAVKLDGRWVPETDARSLPEIKISKSFKENLNSPRQDVREYTIEKINAAMALCESIKRRQRTIETIATEIFTRQQDFFDLGFKALKPLTESEVAKKAGVSVATVSRAVRDKYASTPRGIIELRRFFTSGVTTKDGVAFSQESVMAKLREIVSSEDSACPYSDESLAKKLKESGFPIARRTVAKYRDLLGIPPKSER